jgi:hypothetical protein
MVGKQSTDVFELRRRHFSTALSARICKHFNRNLSALRGTNSTLSIEFDVDIQR